MKSQTTSASPICVCTNLRKTARAISNIYDSALAPVGIKITQLSLLRAVERAEPIGISELADEMALDRTTLARNLAPMERDGFVELSPGADQRVTEVRLTRKGRQRIDDALPLWSRTQAEIARLLTPGRIEQIQTIAHEATHAAAAFVAPSVRKRKSRQ